MGKRGEGWVLLQIPLMAAIIIAPRVPSAAFPGWLRWLGALLILGGGVFALSGMRSLGRNLTSVPKPVVDGHLITNGAYAYVRHPIYSGAVLAALGWALLRSNLLGLLLAGALGVFFDLKSRHEERWLEEAYPGYAAYKRRVRKLIPWVY